MMNNTAINNTTINLLPLDVCDRSWLRFDKKTLPKKICGKWALYFNDKLLMNEVWKVAIKSLMEDKLYGVQSLACSTNYVGKSGHSRICTIGTLTFACDVSPDEENEEIIMNVGKNILEIFNYDERQTVYYKSDQSTFIKKEFTIPTSTHYTYKLDNHLYIKKVENIMGDNDVH